MHMQTVGLQESPLSFQQACLWSWQKSSAVSRMLFCYARERHIMFASLPTLCADSSMKLFINELVRADAQQALPVQHADVSVWQQDLRQEASHIHSLARLLQTLLLRVTEQPLLLVGTLPLLLADVHKRLLTIFCISVRLCPDLGWHHLFELQARQR